MAESWKKEKEMYKSCARIKRTKPEYQVDESILTNIGSNYRTIPTFELSLFKEVFIKHYSLQRNERLNCRWIKYKENIEKRVAAPMQVPNANDLQFLNCAIRFAPRTGHDNRMKLKAGPGVDRFGQMPIPQELLMKRSGEIEKVDKGHQKKTKNAQNQTE